MIKVIETFEFSEWMVKLRDPAARTRIVARIKRLEGGNFGDCKPVGKGVNEMRINYGPGYRVYFKRTSNEILILLCGGAKKTQSRDIERAIRLAETIEIKDRHDEKN
jgi:putative addiction module killer protein